MIPQGIDGIRHIATRILNHHIPNFEDGYTAADFLIISELINFIAQDFDRAVDVLVRDHADMLDLMREAEPHITDKTLKVRIGEALTREAKSLRVADLNERGDFVMKVLIDLHATIEQAADEGAKWASQLNDRMWRFLGDHVTRHSYQSGF
jgi:hypothetical protein